MDLGSNDPFGGYLSDAETAALQQEISGRS
jgi:hypothetical protein